MASESLGEHASPNFMHGAMPLVFCITLLLALRFQANRVQQQRDAAALASSTTSDEIDIATSEFKAFQRNYLLVFLVMMFADWLQGPYTYALYAYYGYNIQQIGVLFSIGYGTSLLAGIFIGAVTDKLGRKRMCLFFAVAYGISCLVKHSPDFGFLMVGRILGGTATSILFSAFESWMVSQHHAKHYANSLLASTFSKATFGNGIAAILAGAGAGAVHDSFGPVAPFDFSFVMLMIGGGIIAFTWEENFGDQTISISAGMRNSISVVYTDRKVLYLGVAQSMFESSMYIWVFMWTPALEEASSEPIHHGLIFATFMVAVLIGSTIFDNIEAAKRNIASDAVIMLTFAVVCMLTPVIADSYFLRLAAFCGFEAACGLLWPFFGTQRGQIVPENVRATVMNIFRIPLNAVVVTVLMHVDAMARNTVFELCAVLLTCSLLAQIALNQTVREGK